MTDACKNRDSLSVPDESADDFVSSVVKLTVGAGTASVFLPFYSDNGSKASSTHVSRNRAQRISPFWVSSRLDPYAIGSIGCHSLPTRNASLIPEPNHDRNLTTASVTFTLRSSIHLFGLLCRPPGWLDPLSRTMTEIQINVLVHAQNPPLGDVSYDGIMLWF